MPDEIVAEVRKWREEYAKQFNYDVHAIFEDLRKKQAARGRKLVSFARKKPQMPTTNPRDGTAEVARRVAKLEAEVAKLKARLDAIEKAPKWWERIVGTFRDDPAYEEAMRLGRQYRESQRPKRKKRSKKQSPTKR